LGEIPRQFPRPVPDPGVDGAAEAIRRGERACAGKTPSGVRLRFEASATLDPDQRELVAKITSFERIASRDTGFQAEQLAGFVYEQTLPARVARYGYQGCVYSLARVLKHRLEREAES